MRAQARVPNIVHNSIRTEKEDSAFSGTYRSHRTVTEFFLQGMLPKFSYSTRLPTQIMSHRRSDSRLIRCVFFRLCALHTGAPNVVPSWLFPFLVGDIVYYPSELRISILVRFIV